ncbi:hypothetical protein AB685_01020 [Bacillus sp. LL01]|uniref:hypothetical protein n=1 Tax=Bacillus sp. LL01 TaxID=1665556 RepID=UPI00064D2849|nr:hypothetical protein [Bacillus sp. LL01]KMJ59492.1 hypothetical protein AB685_01020 [Bacillus sp. LL01]
MSTWILRGESINMKSNTISFQLDMYEQFHLQEMKAGDKVFYCDTTDIICICQVKSITMYNQINITLDIVDLGDPLPLKYVRKLWGLKNLDIFKVADIKVLLLEKDEERLLYSYWKVPGSVEGLVKYDHLDLHLFLYSRVAEVWIGDIEKQTSKYQFFSAFRREEFLSTMSWEDFQNLGDQLSVLQVTPPKERIFAKQKAPIERYRQYFLSLLFGEGSIDKRLDSFYRDSDRRLIGFGNKAIGEMIHYFFPNFFCRFTNQEIMALEKLFKDTDIVKSTYTIGSKIYHFQKLINESYLLNKYLNIVGRKTDLPIYYEINCFLQYIYDTHSEDSVTVERYEVKENKVKENSQYWIYSIPKSVDANSFLEDCMLTFNHGKLGDIRNYSTRKDVWKSYRQAYNATQIPYLETSVLYQFCHEMKDGDYVFVKNDKEQIVGFGRISSPYMFPEFPNSPSYRKIEWIRTGKWIVSGMLFSRKPLVNITTNEATLTYLLDIIPVE